MQNERRQAIQDPFGVPVEGGVVSDVAMVQQAFGVTLSYQDIAFRERLNVLRARFPLRAAAASARIAATTFWCSEKGACHRCLSVCARPRPVSCLNTSLTSAPTSTSQVSKPKSE